MTTASFQDLHLTAGLSLIVYNSFYCCFTNVAQGPGTYEFLFRVMSLRFKLGIVLVHLDILQQFSLP